MRRALLLPAATAAFLVVSIGACDGATDPTGPDEVPLTAAAEPAAIVPLETVTYGGGSLELWPYTARTPNLGDAADPVNVFVRGAVDPTELRIRLMYLDGDRSAFPFPDIDMFRCRWTDALGDPQAVWASDEGWSGSAVQLECGDYATLRFHIRLFSFEGWTVIGAHMDLLIPGTPRHEVISWELAEQLILADLIRLGAAPGGLTQVINATPSYRTIQAPIFAGIPAGLKGLLLATGSVDAAGNVLTDGRASLATVPPAPLENGAAELARQTLTLPFDQVIPRPFCTGDGQDWVYVKGAVTLEQKVVYTPSGNYLSRHRTRGDLEITMVDDPITRNPVSETYGGRVDFHGTARITDTRGLFTEHQTQVEFRGEGGERGSLSLTMQVRPGGASFTDVSVSCKG